MEIPIEHVYLHCPHMVLSLSMNNNQMKSKIAISYEDFTAAKICFNISYEDFTAAKICFNISLRSLVLPLATAWS